MQQLLDPAYNLQAKITDIMFQWAGVQNAAVSHPTGVDGRIVAFLEKLNDQPFTNQNPAAFGQLMEAWNVASGTFAGHILMQAGLGVLYHNPVYDPAADVLSGLDGANRNITLRFDTTGTDYFTNDPMDNVFVFHKGNTLTNGPDYIYGTATDGLDTLLLSGVNPSDVRMWTDGYAYLHVKYGTAGDEVALGGAFEYGATETTARSYVERIAFDNGTVWNLSTGMTMTDTDDAHQLYGTSAPDVIDGRGGDDSIYGGGGSDTLIGGLGRDYLTGGTGNDSYVFAAGQSLISNPDMISEALNEGNDAIRLNGINPADVRMWTDGYGNLNIQYSLTDSIYVYGGMDYTTQTTTVWKYLERVIFDNGTTWNFTTGMNMTDSDDTHQLYGTVMNDTLDGRGGDDSIYAGPGDDTLIGGLGRDYLTGSTGNDTYVFSVGHSAIANPDLISEALNEGTDTIKLTGVNPTDVRLWTDGYGNLNIQYSLTDSIYIYGGFDYTTQTTTVNKYIEKVAFDNGTTWDLTLGLNMTDTDDTHQLYGTNLAETLDGRGGDDSI